MATMIDNLVSQDILGQGKSAKVTLVYDQNTQNNFAMKNFEEKEEWEREQYALSQLRHPNIIRQFESRDNYILLEFCNNGELFDYVKEYGYFPEQIAKYYFRQLLDAIYYVHAHGFIHGDIKLENLLLDNEFNLKLADFGFAQKDQPRDDTFNLMGTEGYFAPEQLRREEHFGQPCDVFQMAVTLFSMIAGVPPYHREASDKDHFYKLIIQRKLTQYWSIIQKQTNREYSASLKDLINCMLQNRPNMRITVEEMREHKWVTSNDVASPDEVREFMSSIRNRIHENKLNLSTDGQTSMSE